MSFQVICGEARAVLAGMEANSVDCCVTSPPYWGLRDYGIPDQVWGGDPEHEHVWGEMVSVNATNHTDKRRWNHTRNGRDEEQPKEKQVAWLRTEVGQGAFCECGAWRGSLGLEPNPHLFVEHIVTVFQAVRLQHPPHGTCWVNLGDTYHNADKWGGGGANTGKHTKDDSGDVPSWTAVRRKWATVPGLKPKDLVGIPWRCAFALQEDGWWLRSDIIWAKPAPMPESVTDRPTRSHEYIFLLTKSAKYHYDAEAIKEPVVSDHGSGNGYRRDSRLTYQGRGSEEPWTPPPGAKGNAKTFRGGGKYTQGQSFDNSTPVGRESHGNAPSLTGLRNKRDVWTIGTMPTPEAHFATYPLELPETCILAGCPVGGLVLDPFSGAGTTGLAAVKNGRNYIGIELNPEYIKITDARTDRRMPLFT